MDPQIVRDLELRLIGDPAYRLRLMGIKTDIARVLEPCDVAWGRFAHAIRYGPWAQVVRRREEALRQRHFHLETMAWMFGWGDSTYRQEIWR